MTGIYDSDMGQWDGLVRGARYELNYLNEDQYLVKNNGYGGTSTISKEKFVEIEEPLDYLAEKAVEENKCQ